jgi:hypothetical protein
MGQEPMTAPSVAPLTEAVTITIAGTPCFSYSPNTRTHWRVRAREAREIKEATILACREAGSPQIHGPVTLEWHIAAAKRRQFMDRTNAIACLKAHEDGLVAAGVIDADTQDIVTDIYVGQHLWQTHKCNGGFVTVIVTPVADAPGWLGYE